MLILFREFGVCRPCYYNFSPCMPTPLWHYGEDIFSQPDQYFAVLGAQNLLFGKFILSQNDGWRILKHWHCEKIGREARNNGSKRRKIARKKRVRLTEYNQVAAAFFFFQSANLLTGSQPDGTFRTFWVTKNVDRRHFNRLKPSIRIFCD